MRARSKGLRSFRFVELQGAGDGFEHALGDALKVAALDLDVVVGANPREHRDLLTAQAQHAAVTAVGREASLLRRDLGASRHQEIADLHASVHASTVRRASVGWEALPEPGSGNAV